MAMYRKTATAGKTGNPSLSIQVRPKASLNETIYSTFGNSESVISTVVIVTGLLTGIQHNVNVKLKYQ
jgi:hypothetical protein